MPLQPPPDRSGPDVSTGDRTENAWSICCSMKGRHLPISCQVRLPCAMSAPGRANRAEKDAKFTCHARGFVWMRCKSSSSSRFEMKSGTYQTFGGARQSWHLTASLHILLSESVRVRLPSSKFTWAQARLSAGIPAHRFSFCLYMNQSA